MRLKFRGEHYGLCATPTTGATHDSARSQVAANRDAIWGTLRDLLQDARRKRDSSSPDVDAIHQGSLAELNKLHRDFYQGDAR